ncbi:Glu/Leu/Phe/Val dehydrogenase [archaeon]|nr:Glu/Leu/Phe/Val dehydrogenase [archaeon]
MIILLGKNVKGIVIMVKIKYDEFGPEKILEVYDPKTKMRGFIVIHSTVLGPAKGGIRMESDVTKEEVYGLAQAMTWKCALADLPFGGGKSSIIADPKAKNKQEIVAAFARAIKVICLNNYVAAPDMNMGEREIETFAKTNGDLKSITGKPLNMGGLPHELGSTGFGVHLSTLIALKHKNIDVKESTIAIEGYGNVGQFTAKFLSKKGAKIVAISDSKGTAYFEDGFDVEKLTKIKTTTKSVINYPGCIVKTTKELFELEVDVLIPGARPEVITKTNVNNIKAKIIVEASNIPMSYEMEEILHNKNILVIPDFVANAGGVISSYVEYIGGNNDEAFKMIEEKITKNTQLMLQHAKEKGLIPRVAALEIAKARIKKAMIKRQEKELKENKNNNI